jgi:hypothetical protein
MNQNIEGKVKYDDTAPVLVVYQILEIIKEERQVNRVAPFYTNNYYIRI